MSSQANKKDYVYRAILDHFIKEDGRISSAAFRDPKGLSVEIGDGRKDKDVVAHMRRTKLQGDVAKISIEVCDNADILIYNDNSKNTYHRLLLSKTHEQSGNKILSRGQARTLAANSELLEDNVIVTTA